MTEAAQERENRALLGVAEVEGPSMVPTLLPGDQLLVRYGARVRPGQVVILRHPLQQDLLVVKRAVERRPGGWWVLGDNPGAGGDSEDYGTVPEEFVLARVLIRFRPRRVAAGSRAGQRSGLPAWLLSAVRPLPADRSASRRLRAR